MSQDNNLSIADRNLKGYIHDLLEMEKTIFSLEQMSVEYQKKGTEREKTAKAREQKLKTAISENEAAIARRLQLLQEKEAMLSIKHQKKPEKKQKKEKSSSAGFWVELETLFFLIGGILGIAAIVILTCLAVAYVLVGFVWVELLDHDFHFTQVLITGGVLLAVVALGALGLFAIGHFGGAKEGKAAILKDIETYKQQISDLKIRLEEDKLAYSEALRDVPVAEMARKLMHQQSEDCKKSAQMVRNQLEKCYALDIVPQKYRTLESLLTFDQIFRNDLADDMVQAEKIFLQRERRNETLKELKKAYDNLDAVSAEVGYLQGALLDIRMQVREMVKDMDRIGMQMAISESQQEQILAQTKATRYAVEAVRDSQDCVERYITNNYL